MRHPFILTLALLAACGAEPPPDARAKALAWLRSRQSADGAWRSEKYGVLGQGHALTAFLAFVTGDEKALGWLRGRVAEDGSLGTSEGVAEYPTYATAFGVRALARTGTDSERVARMVDYLKRSQFREPDWPEPRTEHGGWAYARESTSAAQVRYLNLSVTACVLEALAEAGVSADDPVWARARKFVERLKASDGAWPFTPLDDPLNKAGQGVGYGTPTADAGLALAACGADATAALAWLEPRFDVARVPGLGNDYGRGLRFYWLARAAALLPARRAEIRRELESCQRQDGSWVNDAALMREDDPLVATGLALWALRLCDAPAAPR